ncbi:MAG: rhodanese-like domain-containing protein [Chitinophagaceae bacterium]
MLKSIFKMLFGSSNSINLKEIIQQGAFLVDVRTPNEFASGHVPGSVNIPLDTIRNQLHKFKNKKNIIVFCRSGNRSSMAKQILEKNGIQPVYNGGTWQQVKSSL